MALSLFFICFFVTIGIGIYSAWVTYMNLRSEDYEIDFNKLLSKSYLDHIDDKERLSRLLKVKLWKRSFTFVLLSYLASSLFLAVYMNLNLLA